LRIGWPFPQTCHEESWVAGRWRGFFQPIRERARLFYDFLSRFTTIHTITGDDGQCQCELVQGSDGLIYGISGNLGSAGDGTVDLGLPKPAPQALSFTPESGPPGTQVRIWGYNLLRASVQLSGTSATGVRNSGPNYVFATVPNGTTSGPVTVTTPGGTSTTAASFTVQ
jgi:hypothetical protein